MNNNTNKTREDILADEALEELLSLSGKKKSNKPQRLGELLKERDKMVATKLQKTAKPTGLAAILQNVKKNQSAVNKDMWQNPTSEKEKQLEKQLKEKKKSAYDSDVLRERILRRQAEKRGFDNPTASLLSNVSKNKKDFEDR